MLKIPKSAKRKDYNRHADRFYDYIMAHRGEVLRCAAALLVTGLIEYLLVLFLPFGSANNMIAFAIRFFLLFYIAKFWVYREIGSGGFYTGRQMMLAIMIMTVSVFVFNYLTIFLAGFFEKPVLIRYILRALFEILYFAVFQFLIFKEPEND